MLNPLPFVKDGVQTLLVCEHWKSFPPLEVYQVGDDPDPRALRQAIQEDARYNFFLVWKRICGVREMQLDKCQECPCARWLKDRGSEIPLLISLKDGTEMAAVDIPQHNVLPRNRQNTVYQQRPDGKIGSPRLASWLQQAQVDPKGEEDG